MAFAIFSNFSPLCCMLLLWINENSKLGVGFEKKNNIHAAIVEIILSSVNVSKLWQNFIEINTLLKLSFQPSSWWHCICMGIKTRYIVQLLSTKYDFFLQTGWCLEFLLLFLSKEKKICISKKICNYVVGGCLYIIHNQLFFYFLLPTK